MPTEVMDSNPGDYFIYMVLWPKFFWTALQGILEGIIRHHLIIQIHPTHCHTIIPNTLTFTIYTSLTFLLHFWVMKCGDQGNILLVLSFHNHNTIAFLAFSLL
jgi:hypothetical protein